MSIEKDLATIASNSTRIADALEAIAKSGVGAISVPGLTELTSTTETVGAVSVTETKATRKPAEKKAETKPEPETPPADEAKADGPAEEKADKIVHEEAEPQPERDPLDEDDAAPTFTKDEVRAALKAYREIEGSAAMMEVLKNAGAETISELKEDKYAEVMKVIK